MADFVANLAADAAIIVTEQALGQTVQYLALDQNPATVAAVWDPDSQEATTFSNERDELDHGVLQTKIADTPSPDTRDTFTINGIKWAVRVVTIAEWIVQWDLILWKAQRLGGTEQHER